MSEKNDKPEVVETEPQEQAATDWREAFDHAVNAAREAFSAAAEATAEVLRQGSKLADQTLTEAQRTVVVTLDAETITALDKLVSAGMHKNRAEAIRHLLRQGVQASGDVLARIDQVEAEIENLRKKMRDIPIEGAAA